ncbi:hypothetical protein CSUI_008647, partial [Cystoisospora suis]
MAISLHSRLVAAMPRCASDVVKAFDLDDVVQKKRPGRSASGGTRHGAQGLVVRTYRGILEGSEDDDPDSMNPEAHEVQIAWEDGAVENVARDQLELVDRPFYAGDLVVSNKDGKRLGLILEVEQTASVRLVPSREMQRSSGDAGGSAGVRSSSLPRAVSADALSLVSQELPSSSTGNTGICVQDVRLNSLQYWPLYPSPPLLRPLHAFEVGTSVIKDGRLGAIVTCKVDYLVQLDSGHRFTLEYGMEGVRPEPRQGFPVDPYGMFPSQRVYVKGEWLRNFQEQLRQHRRERGGPSADEPSAEVAAAENAHRLCRGFVKSFAVRNVKVNWLLDAYESWSADPSYPVATSQASEHDCSELLPVQQLVLRLGQPVYLNIRHQSSPFSPFLCGDASSVSASNTKNWISLDKAKGDPTHCAHIGESALESETDLGNGEAGPSIQKGQAFSVATEGEDHVEEERTENKGQNDKHSSPLYRLGIVSSLCTRCTVLWEDGNIEENVAGQGMTPVNVDRVPLSQSDYIVNIAILPHMYVTRKWTQEELDRLAEEEEKAELAARAHGPPWWNSPYFGGVELSEETEIPQDLKAVEAVKALTRVCREMGLSDGRLASFPGRTTEDEGASGAGEEAEADSRGDVEEDRGRRRRRRRSLLRRRGNNGGRESSSRGGDPGRGDGAVSDDDENCWEDCLESDQEPDGQFHDGGPTDGMEEGDSRSNGGGASTASLNQKSCSAAGSSSEKEKTSSSGLVAGSTGDDAVHRLQEIFKCLQETVGPGNMSLPLYRRVPVLRGGLKRCNSASSSPGSLEQQRCRAPGRPGDDARASGSGKDSTAAPRTPGLSEVTFLKDRLVSQTAENGQRTPTVCRNELGESVPSDSCQVGAGCRSSPVRMLVDAEERAEGEPEEAPARLNSLVGNMVRGEVRRRELLQLVEFLRMAGAGGTGTSTSTYSPGTAGSSDNPNSTSTSLTPANSASTRGRLDPAQIQGVVTCLMALRGDGRGCFPFRSRGGKGFGKGVQGDDTNGVEFKEDARGLGVVVSVKRAEKRATVAWLENPAEFFLRARKLRAEMTAAEGHGVQILEDQKRKKAVELQLARFGIAMWDQGRKCQGSQFQTQEAKRPFYKEAAAAYSEGGLLADLVRLEDVPLSDLSPMSRFLFFPGDCALLLEPKKAIREEKVFDCASATCETRKDVPGTEVSGGIGSQEGVNSASDAGSLLPQDQMDKDKKVYLQVMANIAASETRQKRTWSYMALSPTLSPSTVKRSPSTDQQGCMRGLEKKHRSSTDLWRASVVSYFGWEVGAICSKRACALEHPVVRHGALLRR